jgi:hypothetical protein
MLVRTVPEAEAAVATNGPLFIALPPSQSQNDGNDMLNELPKGGQMKDRCGYDLNGV